MTFLDAPLKPRSRKERIDELDLLKTKNFFFAKDSVKIMGRDGTDREKILVRHI